MELRRTAIAAAISSIWAPVTSPSFRTNRVSGTDFTWNASAPESFERPFSDAAGRQTNQERFPKSLFQSVTGTTIRRGRRQMAYRLTTTAGRTLRISAPAEGSNRTSQTSLLFGVGTVAMKVLLAESLAVG